MSGLQDHRKGEYESSTHVAQVTLGNKAVHLLVVPAHLRRRLRPAPRLLVGHTTLPRVIQERNVMSLTWRLTAAGLDEPLLL